MPELTEEQKKEFDKWAREREAEMFEVDKFKRIGKEHDYYFQILCFMQTASQKMSLAFTLTDMLDDFPKELEKEFREIAGKYHDLQDKVRKLKQEEEREYVKYPKCDGVGLPNIFYVKCVEDITAMTARKVVAWEVKKGEEFKVGLFEKTQEYFTTDSRNREVYVGSVDKNGLIHINSEFQLLPVSQSKFNYIYD